MKVAMYYNNKDVRIEDLPVPEINDDELLVKVKASGICGSDVMEWYRIKKAPRVLGHEVAGEITEVGKNVQNYKKGDRVFVSHHVNCSECSQCKTGHETACETLHSTNFEPGGFSEFIKVSKINVEKGVYVLPDSISFEEGTFIEPLGCAVRGQRIAKVGKNQTVLVIGSGIAGLLHIQLAKALGAKKVIATDINEYRLKAAKKFGADETYNAKDLPEIKADRVLICTAALPAIKQGLDSVGKGGFVLFFAPTKQGVEVPVPLWDIWVKDVTLTVSYAAVKEDLQKAIELISEKKVNVKDMITHRLSLDEAAKGFELVAKAEDSLKVIIEPK